MKLTPMYAGLCNAITDILQLPNGDIICSSQLGILYRSTDGGNNFSATNTAPGSILPILTDPGRTELAQSHLNGNTFLCGICLSQ
ncbi:MAG: exo-alpha-sialidase [Sphingobacteriales bacterium]|nr:exo-alpha-sialidase [Sphingobacteriales bacterium]